MSAERIHTSKKIQCPKSLNIFNAKTLIFNSFRALKKEAVQCTYIQMVLVIVAKRLRFGSKNEGRAGINSSPPKNSGKINDSFTHHRYIKPSTNIWVGKMKIHLESSKSNIVCEYEKKIHSSYFGIINPR